MPKKKLTAKQKETLHCDLHPISDWVAIIPDEAENRIGSIILADIAKPRPTRGTVLVTGPGRPVDHDGGEEVIPMSVKTGDYVLFDRGSGKDVRVKGIDVRLVREEGILAVVEEL